ncbi:hypothetical protein [Lentzea sp. NPDC055074]
MFENASAYRRAPSTVSTWKKSAATIPRPAQSETPMRIITHTLRLDEAERGFEMFKNEEDDCEKVVLKP